MFKKLMSFLFEEVDVVEEEIEPKYDPSLSQEGETVSKMKMIDLEEEEPIIEDVPLVHQKSLDFSSEKYERKVEVKPILKKESSQPVPYQASGIISPIFGKKDQASTSTKVQQTPLSLPQENTSVIGTIFSPIYGVVRGKPVVNKTQVETSKHVSMDDLFNEDVVSIPVVKQPSMDELFIDEPKKPKVDVKPDHHFFDDPSQESEDESVQTMFRSLFDEQE
ncbi:MAG: hypothetical protein KGZ51_03770 [Erysipelothrix sp.]|nr:hypothetical protein [Erysipelothrix sp.]